VVKDLVKIVLGSSEGRLLPVALRLGRFVALYYRSFILYHVC